MNCSRSLFNWHRCSLICWNPTPRARRWPSRPIRCWRRRCRRNRRVRKSTTTTTTIMRGICTTRMRTTNPTQNRTRNLRMIRTMMNPYTRRGSSTWWVSSPLWLNMVLWRRYSTCYRASITFYFMVSKIFTNSTELNTSIYKYCQRVIELLNAEWLFF